MVEWEKLTPELWVSRGPTVLSIYVRLIQYDSHWGRPDGWYVWTMSSDIKGPYNTAAAAKLAGELMYG